MKKELQSKILLGIFIISLVSILTVSVFADTVDPDTVKETAKTGIQAAFAPIIGIIQGVFELIFGSQWLNLTRFFFFVLLVLVIWTIMPLILGEERRALNFWISVVIAIISILGIPPQLLDALVANYGAMGAALLTVIPFAIVLVFSIRVQNALLARVIWIFYCVYYFCLYIYKLVVVSTTSVTPASDSIYYVGALIAGIFMFFFIGSIRDIIFRGKMDALKETGTQIARRGKLLHKLQKKELEEAYG